MLEWLKTRNNYAINKTRVIERDGVTIGLPQERVLMGDIEIEVKLPDTDVINIQNAIQKRHYKPIVRVRLVAESGAYTAVVEASNLE